jgi:LysM repeat protein
MGAIFNFRIFVFNGNLFQFFLLMIFLVTCTRVMQAQETRVQRAANTVIVNGQRFYMHRVEAGQTLFSIARAYEVTVEEIKRVNGKSDDAISPGEMLRVPYVEPYRPFDDTYYYHKMKPRETLYSLSRQYNVRVKRILKDNPEYDESRPLPVGAIVKLYLKQLDRFAVENELRREEAARRALEPPAVEEPRQEIALSYPEEPVEESTRVKLSVLLPFGVKENRLPLFEEIEMDPEGNQLNDERWRLSARSEPFVEFYSGLLVAIDSLKHAGYTIDLQVHDTRSDSSRIDFIMHEVNRFAPHLVIGPVHANEYARVAGRLLHRDVPVIYPLSTRTEGLGRFPNFVQVTASTTTLLDAMAEWTARWAVDSTASRGRRRSVFAVIPPATVPRGEEGDLPDRVRQRLAAVGKSVTIFHWDGASLTPLKDLMDAEQENLILFPTLDEAIASKFLPALSAWSGRYRVTVAGFPEWLKFTVVDEETLFKVNLVLFQSAHVDGESPREAAFARKYRTFFHAEPTIMAHKAFDIGLFFIRQVATHRERTLESLARTNESGDFTRFRFAPLPGMPGLENRGFFLVNYTPAFEIKITPLD